MRETIVQSPIGSADSLAWHAARMLAAGLQQVWRGCQIAGWLLARQRTRRALAALDDRMLRDVGITRAQALREAEKPLWMA